MKKSDAARALRRAYRIVFAELCASLAARRLAWDTRNEDAMPSLVPVAGAADAQRLFFVRHEETSEEGEDERNCTAIVYANAEAVGAHLRQPETQRRLFDRLRERGYSVVASSLEVRGLFELHVIARCDGARMRGHDRDEIFSAIFSVDDVSAREADPRPVLRLVR